MFRVHISLEHRPEYEDDWTVVKEVMRDTHCTELEEAVKAFEQEIDRMNDL